MDALEKELCTLKEDLKTLVPQALRALARDGRLAPEDPMDVVGISYVSVGNGSVFNWLSVRTVSEGEFLTKLDPQDIEMPWRTPEFEISDDLIEFVSPPASYTSACERLLPLALEADEERDDEDEDFPELGQLQAAVQEVALWLTKNWKDQSVPSVAHPVFFAVDWYEQGQPGNYVARSVDPADLQRAGFAIPPISCYHCSQEFAAPVHERGQPFHCPDCGKTR